MLSVSIFVKRCWKSVIKYCFGTTFWSPEVVWGSFGGRFWSYELMTSSLVKGWNDFWCILEPGLPKRTERVISFGPFWEDFGPDLDLFGGPKVRKSGPKSIPKTNRFLDLDFS